MKALASNIDAGVYNASMSSKRATSTSSTTSDSDPGRSRVSPEKPERVRPSEASGGQGNGQGPQAGSVLRDSAAKVVLRRGRARPLWFGHPWVYANAVDRVEGTVEPGCVVSLLDHDGRFIGRGIYNSRSQIPVRLLSRTDEHVDAAFFVRRLRAAQALRAKLALPSSETTAYRLVNSEGDNLPGLVVDVFGDAAAFQISTLGMALWREEIAGAIDEVLAPKSIFEVAAGSFAEVEGFVAESRVVRGESRP